jgi:hypothetical protein
MPPCRPKSGDSAFPAGFPVVTGLVKGYLEPYRLDFSGQMFIAFRMILTHLILKLHDEKVADHNF